MKTTATTLTAVVGLILATAAPALADPVGGPVGPIQDQVEARSTDTWTFRLYGGEVTRIRLVGDGDTCLELRVYDEFGNLVASDTRGLGDRRCVFVTPRRTGPFKVQVKNLGSVYNVYKLMLD